MGIVKKDALRTSIVAYLGLMLGYLNKGFLFIIFLSTEEIGLINLIASVATLFAQFSSLGTFNSIWRFYPILQSKEKKNHGFLGFNMLIALSGASIITLLAYLFSSEIQAYYNYKSPLFSAYFIWVIPTGIAVLFFMLLDNYSRALQKSVFATVANDVILRLLTTVLILIYAFELLSFNSFVVAVCLLQWVPTILLALYIRYLGEWNVSPKYIAISSKMKRIILNYSGFNYLNSMGTSVIITIDALMVAGMIGMSETGVYTTITFVSRALTIPYAAIMRVSAPLVPKLWKERNTEGMKELYQKVSSVSLIIGLTLFMLVWVNREDLFQLLPKEFEAGIYVFLFIMIGRIVDMFCGLNGTILITSKKYKYDVIFTAALMILVVVLNLQMIPLWGMVGAAISTATAYILFNVARIVFVWAQFKIHPFTTRQFIALLVFIGSIAAIEYIPISIGNPIMGVLTRSLLTIALFPGVIYFFNIEPETVGYVNSVLKKLKMKKT